MTETLPHPENVLLYIQGVRAKVALRYLDDEIVSFSDIIVY